MKVRIFALFLSGSNLIYIIEDSILIMRDLGVQLSSTGRFYFFGGSNLFLSKGEILDILIQEAFVGVGVKFFLIIMVANDRKFHVVFENLDPRIHVLEKVWKSTRKSLYGNYKAGMMEEIIMR